MAQSVVSMNVVEKEVDKKWVPQSYIVVTKNNGTNGVVLFDKNYVAVSSTTLINKTRVGIPNTHDGNYRVRSIQ
jgi:hypothetical protein